MELEPIPKAKRSIGMRPGKHPGHIGNGGACKLTDKVAQSIYRSRARAGHSITVACRAAGIDPSTYRGWLEKGRREPQPGDKLGKYRAFVQLMEQADAVFERDAIDALAERGFDGVTVKEVVKVDAEGNETREMHTTHAPDSKLLQWLLKQRFPDKYADRSEQRITVEEIGPPTDITFNVIHRSPKDLGYPDPDVIEAMSTEVEDAEIVEDGAAPTD